MNLGAIPTKIDSRNIMLGSVQAPIDIPKEYKTDISGLKKFYQNGQPACGSHSGAFFKQVQQKLEGKHDQLSPRFLWAEIKKIDGYDPSEGTDMKSIFKTLQSTGVCLESLLPNTIELSLTNYTYPKITYEMLEDAQNRIGGAYAYKFNPSFEDLKQGIYQNKVILILIRCDDGFFRTKNPTFTQRKYGHFVVAYGYDEQGIYIVDSTEKDFDLSEKYIDKKYISFIYELGTMLDIPDEQIILMTKQISLMKKVVNLLIQLKQKSRI